MSETDDLSQEKRMALIRGAAAFLIFFVVVSLAKEYLVHGSWAYWIVAAVGFVFLLISALNVFPVILLDIVETLPKKPPDVSREAVDVATHELREVADHYAWSDEELSDDLELIADRVRDDFGKESKQ